MYKMRMSTAFVCRRWTALYPFQREGVQFGLKVQVKLHRHHPCKIRHKYIQWVPYREGCLHTYLFVHYAFVHWMHLSLPVPDLQGRVLIGDEMGLGKTLQVSATHTQSAPEVTRIS